jgi:hypothetical protein
MSQSRIGDHHRERIAQPLPQRYGERQAGKAGPGDDNFGSLFGGPFIHRAFLVNLAAA